MWYWVCAVEGSFTERRGKGLRSRVPGLSQSRLLHPEGSHLLLFLEPSQLAPPTGHVSLWGVLLAATAVNLCVQPGPLLATDEAPGIHHSPRHLQPLPALKLRCEQRTSQFCRRWGKEDLLWPVVLGKFSLSHQTRHQEGRGRIISQTVAAGVWSGDHSHGRGPGRRPVTVSADMAAPQEF